MGYTFLAIGAFGMSIGGLMAVYGTLNLDDTSGHTFPPMLFLMVGLVITFISVGTVEYLNDCY